LKQTIIPSIKPATIVEFICYQASPSYNLGKFLGILKGLLQPLSIPSERWEEVSMDFITVLPKSKGKSVIMVLVDRLTKYAHFCALSHPFKASTVSTAFMETIQKLHGNQKIPLSDRDPIFIGNFWT